MDRRTFASPQTRLTHVTIELSDDDMVVLGQWWRRYLPDEYPNHTLVIRDIIRRVAEGMPQVGHPGGKGG